MTSSVSVSNVIRVVLPATSCSTSSTLQAFPVRRKHAARIPDQKSLESSLKILKDSQIQFSEQTAEVAHAIRDLATTNRAK
jgi:hypothetical protein